jgi:hypothetical protein
VQLAFGLGIWLELYRVNGCSYIVWYRKIMIYRSHNKPGVGATVGFWVGDLVGTVCESYLIG